VILILIVFIFSIVGNSFIQHQDWTLFRLICGDEWPDILNHIESSPGSRFFIVFFVCIGNFVFANVFIGLIITNISDAQEKYKKEKRIEK
jgi:hypothetical protein